MKIFNIEVRDRATIDIVAYVDVEAETFEDAVRQLKTDPAFDLEFEQDDRGLGWRDQHNEPEYVDATVEE